MAKVVGEVAQAGDAVALGIMAEAGRHLGSAAIVVLRELGLRDVPAIVTTAGGVFKAGPAVVTPMMDRIHAEFPLAVYQPPHYPPVIGALFLALQSLGVSIDQTVIANIESSRSVWQSRK
jgi:N-acetylglucosamine kinase-like BadF-type ATPase